jgi:hypothetical protein
MQQLVAPFHKVRQRADLACSSEFEGGEKTCGHVLFLSEVDKAQVIV